MRKYLSLLHNIHDFCPLSSKNDKKSAENPCAWERPELDRTQPPHVGNTPTGVGKTISRIRSMRFWEKHPHGRGGDLLETRKDTARPETPPRAWGRLGGHAEGGVAGGNTPTGVGKTMGGSLPAALPRKHPHGRGEDRRGDLRERLHIETPPRAWGRHASTTAAQIPLGNTPTGVGKTPSSRTI